MQVVNLSEGGADTSGMINRFHDVAQTKPDFVVISLSLNNEGLFRDETACDRFEKGIRKLANLVEAIGALPIIATHLIPCTTCTENSIRMADVDYLDS